jgi:hypothetical protein
MCTYVSCVTTRINSDYYTKHNQLTGLRTGYAAGCLCGRNWNFKYYEDEPDALGRAMAVSSRPLISQFRFDPGQFHVKFVVEKVALGEEFLWVLRFSPLNIIPPVPHAHLHLHVNFIKTNGQSLTTVKKQCSLRNLESLDRKVFSILLGFKNLNKVETQIDKISSK